MCLKILDNDRITYVHTMTISNMFIKITIANITYVHTMTISNMFIKITIAIHKKKKKNDYITKLCFCLLAFFLCFCCCFFCFVLLCFVSKLVFNIP